MSSLVVESRHLESQLNCSNQVNQLNMAPGIQETSNNSRSYSYEGSVQVVTPEVDSKIFNAFRDNRQFQINFDNQQVSQYNSIRCDSSNHNEYSSDPEQKGLNTPPLTPTSEDSPADANVQCDTTVNSEGSANEHYMNEAKYSSDDYECMDDMPEYIGVNHLEKLTNSISKSQTNDKSGSGSSEEDKEESVIYQCPVCSYSGASQFHFQAHLNTHYDVQCPRCDFVTHTDNKLKIHLAEEHGVSDSEIEKGVKVPRVSNEKSKKLLCKQCGFKTLDNDEYWEHARGHIKPEKLLTCPKCPFVTEYKHHLEYHLRNHFGSKPFKCPHCNYSCVNKSMLSSHMKSHSAIYQYRCRDCTYVSKYCHSLKLHLRKYNHQPDMVLNADGTPNPLPIIDVYGTRRGPKIRKDERGLPIVPPYIQQTPVTSQPMYTQPKSVPISFPLPPMNGPSPTFTTAPQLQHPNYLSNRKEPTPSLPKGTLKCNVCDYYSSNREEFSKHMVYHASQERSQQQVPDSPSENTSEHKQYPFVPKANVHLSPHFTPHHDRSNTYPTPEKDDHFPRQPEPFHLPPINQLFNRQFTNAIGPNFPLNPHQLMNLPFSFIPTNPSLSYQKDENEIEKHNTEENKEMEQRSPRSICTEGSESSNDATYPSSPLDLTTEGNDRPKRRRKGKAYKLERVSFNEDSDDNTNHRDTQSIYPDPRLESIPAQESTPPRDTEIQMDVIPEQKTPDTKDNSSAGSNSPLAWNKIHECPWCDMAFKDVVMYTMHMGYHSNKNPFTCNMCGFENKDKLEFFTHMVRSPHA